MATIIATAAAVHSAALAPPLGRAALSYRRRATAARMGEWVQLGSCSTRVEVPASTAFALISDYPRWPEWSPWLDKVEVRSDDGATTSRWFLRWKMVNVNWTSKNVEERPSSLVRWESTSGLRNGGRTLVTPEAGRVDACTVDISLRYQIPPLISRVFSTEWVAGFVSKRLAADLERFRAIAEAEHRRTAGRPAARAHGDGPRQRS
mmetsp:Transcript_26846/g.88400  ORF Transcript_26846/g.88400 Transcript_26846/m.88400 type:complete len:206 (-) Transcript_26846:137-754(-)